MDSPRHEVFRSAQAYFGAVAEYWRALRSGEDMETPTQEVLGRSLIYQAALDSYLRKKPGARKLLAHRRKAIALQLQITSRLYQQQHRHER